MDKIEQFRTPTLVEISDEISSFEYTWKLGDKFWQLAHSFYGDKNYWYIIAQFNNKPTESHLNIGDKIKIPYNKTNPWWQIVTLPEEAQIQIVA